MFYNLFVYILISIILHASTQGLTCPVVDFHMGKCLESHPIKPFG